jgi:predicted dehydrogenase
LIRIGIVGTNFGRQVLLPAFRLDPRCEVVAFAGNSGAKTADAARETGVRQSYDDWMQMIERAPIDAVAIATPPRLQAEIAVHALDSGKAVFLEKPLAADWAGAKAVRDRAQAAGRPVTIDFEFAELPTWQRAKALIDAGAIGALRHVIVTWNVESYATQMRLKSWKTAGGDGGGVLGNLASHTFYYIEHLCGPIARMSARLYGLPGAGSDSQSTVTMALDFRSGAAGSAAISAASYLGSGHRIEIYGEDGTLVLNNPTSDYMRGFELFHGRRPVKALERIEVAQGDDPHPDGRIVPVARLVSRFLDAVEGDATPKPGIAEAVRVQSLIAAALLSHQMDSRSVQPTET